MSCHDTLYHDMIYVMTLIKLLNNVYLLSHLLLWPQWYIDALSMN